MPASTRGRSRRPLAGLVTRRRRASPADQRWPTCQLADSNKGTSAGGSGVRPRMWSAAFSAIMIVGAFRLPFVIEEA